MIDVRRMTSAMTHKRSVEGLSVRDAAEILGLSKSAYSRIENGRIPDLMTFGEICDWLAIPVEDFQVSNSTSGQVPSLLVQLRANSDLKSDYKKAIEAIIRAGYKELGIEIS